MGWGEAVTECFQHSSSRSTIDWAGARRTVFGTGTSPRRYDPNFVRRVCPLTVAAGFNLAPSPPTSAASTASMHASNSLFFTNISTCSPNASVTIHTRSSLMANLPAREDYGQNQPRYQNYGQNPAWNPDPASPPIPLSLPSAPRGTHYGQKSQQYGLRVTRDHGQNAPHMLRGLELWPILAGVVAKTCPDYGQTWMPGWPNLIPGWPIFASFAVDLGEDAETGLRCMRGMLAEREPTLLRRSALGWKWKLALVTVGTSRHPDPGLARLLPWN